MLRPHVYQALFSGLKYNAMAHSTLARRWKNCTRRMKACRDQFTRRITDHLIVSEQMTSIMVAKPSSIRKGFPTLHELEISIDLPDVSESTGLVEGEDQIVNAASLIDSVHFCASRDMKSSMSEFCEVFIAEEASICA
jgi:hypothetical protein